MPARPIPFLKFVWLLLLLTWWWPAEAQPIITAPRPTSTNQPDPLAAFMVAQPPIDTAAPITPIVEFEPATITSGQTSVYRVVLNVMEQSIEWPDSIPVPEGCTVRRGASGQFLQNVGGAILPRTTFLYHVRPETTGTFTLPSYTVRARDETVEVPAASLTVVPPGSATVESAPRIELSPRETGFYVGQDIELEATLPGLSTGRIQTLSQVQIVGEGLIVDRNFRSQRVETRVENGVTRPTFVYNVLVTPMRPGSIEVTAQGHTVGNRFQGQIVISGGTTLTGGLPTYQLVDSDPITLNILPLPKASQPPGFTGAIGLFTVDPPTLSTNRVQAGDLVTLSLTVRGRGNLHRILPPGMDPELQWQVFEPRRENLLSSIIRQRGFVTFKYQLIPLDERITSTPAIPFSYFNPKSGVYVDRSIAPIPLTVEPSPTAVAVSGQPSLIEARSFLRTLLDQTEEPTALADTLPLPGRAALNLEPLHTRPWFWAAQVLPAALLGGLWIWDRRRRFFEQYPEVLVRRRARRAIRRHARMARRAARNADARRFLEHAIHGFREASAPAAPADPRALVCSDIISSLPDELRHRDTLRMVERLFTAANEWRFGEAPPDPRLLLGLSREVDQCLETLRRRL